MIVFAAKAVDYIAGLMSKSMHNYSLATMLILWGASVVSVLVFPNPVRLDMAKDVGTVLLGGLGIVGGVHYGKERARLASTTGNGGGDPGAPVS